MYNKDLSNSSQIQYLLKKINMNVRHVMLKEFDYDNLTMHQIFIMKIIKEHPKMNLKTLGSHLNLAKSSVSLTVNKLVEEGYVIRIEDPEDRRNKYIEVSEAGKKILEESNEMAKNIFNNLLSNLTEEDLSEIKNNLSKLDEAIEKAIGN